MLTYDLSKVEGPVYIALYNFIKSDIQTGKLKLREKMPSKRALAKNLGLSTITVENAYDQLIGEGYMYALPKRGYYVSDISHLNRVHIVTHKDASVHIPKEQEVDFDFSSNRIDSNNFPFSIWAKVMRETISTREMDLLKMSPAGGIEELRKSIADHLSSFRGMDIDPNQIVIGAGTEYLYGLLIQLLGFDMVYCVENPGYKKLQQIYGSNNVACKYANMDDKGIIVDELVKSKANIAHVSPTHHFPTGIMMPISRRYELLAWANEKDDRYIIEDDYDSEFRTAGRPIPTLQSIDAGGKVIYMNTFSKSLASTIRISYMVLPEELANRFYSNLGFYACTVSTFEQYTLAEFIRQGYFEKHINRMRLYYGRKRAQTLEAIKRNLPEGSFEVVENDSGLHFLLKLNTKLSDSELEEKLMREKIKIKSITDFYMEDRISSKHSFIINYSGIDIKGLDENLKILRQLAL